DRDRHSRPAAPERDPSAGHAGRRRSPLESHFAQRSGRGERHLPVHRAVPQGHRARQVRHHPLTVDEGGGTIVKRMIAQAGLAALLLPGLAHADIFEKVGTFGGQFLKISVGARGAGMGGAFVAVADDATSVFWNAAGIARVDADKSQLSLNHANWPADLSFDQGGYVFHMKKIPGAFAVHARALPMQPPEGPTTFPPP